MPIFWPLHPEIYPKRPRGIKEEFQSVLEMYLRGLVSRDGDVEFWKAKTVTLSFDK
jgi:hypothetical protein